MTWTEIKITIAVIMLAVIGVLGVYVYILRQERAATEKDLNIALASVTLLARETANGHRAMLVREEEAERLRGETRALSDEIKRLYDKDPAIKEWADTVCPDSVLECLRP